MDEWVAFLKDTGKFSLEDEKIIVGAPNIIQNLKVEAYRAYAPPLFNSKRAYAIKKNIDKIELDYHKAVIKRDYYKSNSAEGIANVAQYRYIIANSVYDGKSKVFDYETTDSFIIDQAISCYFDSIFSEEEIRNMSKIEPWSSIWSCSKIEGSIFNRGSAFLTDMQKTIILWSRLYDNAKECQEKPDPIVFTENFLFDGWWKSFVDSLEKSSKENKNSSGHAENFVIVDNIDDFNRVEGLNSVESMMIKRQRMNVLKDKGIVKEQHMPDSVSSIRQKAVQQASDKMRGMK